MVAVPSPPEKQTKSNHTSVQAFGDAYALHPDTQIHSNLAGGLLQAAREVRVDDENRDTTELSAVEVRGCVLATFRCFV